MKLSSALVVSMTTAALAVMAEEDATATTVNQKHGRHVGYNQDHQHLHQNPNTSTQVQESLQGLKEATTAAVKSDLLFNKEHSSSMGSRTTTIIGSGSGDSVSGDVDIDVGLLPISERLLDSVQEDCAATCNNWNRPVIEEDGTSFQDLITGCIAGEECPDYLNYENVPIGCWDTSDVTDMSNAFSGDLCLEFYVVRPNVFNEPINCWNTAHVTGMNKIFYYATSFNQPLNDWNVARVTDMYRMFNEASNFNQKLDDWNVASVTAMRSMFGGSYSSSTTFNQSLNDWNVASVTDMGAMFNYASYFNQPLDDWNVASVNDMQFMFYKASVFNQCLSTWADKIPPNVSVNDIFGDSGCPNKNDVATVGPWCQGEDEQCLAPSDAPSSPPISASSALPTSALSAPPTSASSTSPIEATIAPIAPTAASNVPPKKKSKKSKK